MTQPVFDVRLIEETQRRTQHLRIPIFTGVWPLLSSRQAEFLHHEVPGIIVPDEVRARLASVGEGAARAEGAKIAEQMVSAALAHFPGVYLITPFLRYEMTTELAKFARSI
jgi:homocysteine S-methyltransferase